MSAEIRSLIEKPENFEYAWAIYEEVKALREQIFIKFWRNVGLNLKSFHNESQHELSYVDIPELGVHREVGIWLGDINSTRSIGVVGGDVLGKPESPYILIYAGESGWSANAKLSIESLRKSCTQHGLKTSKSGGIIGWMRPDALEGLNYEDSRSLITLNQDNANDQHPLATAIAHDMWSCFEKCRSDLEAIWKMH